MNAHFAPGAAANWTRYHATVGVDGLGADGSDVSAGITVYDGSPREMLVSVSTGYVRVSRSGPTSKEVVGESRIPAAPSHVVDVATDTGRVTVTVDQQAVYIGDAADPTAAGGIALSVWRRTPTSPVPTFLDLHVMP